MPSRHLKWRFSEEKCLEHGWIEFFSFPLCLKFKQDLWWWGVTAWNDDSTFIVEIETVELWFRSEKTVWTLNATWRVAADTRQINSSTKERKKITKVDQMWDGVEPGLAEDQPAHNFVEVDTVVQGELVCQPHVPEKRHEVTKHEY